MNTDTLTTKIFTASVESLGTESEYFIVVTVTERYSVITKQWAITRNTPLTSVQVEIMDFIKSYNVTPVNLAYNVQQLMDVIVKHRESYEHP